MLKFLKYLFTGTKPVDNDGTELILGKAEDTAPVLNDLPVAFEDAILPTPAVPDAVVVAGDGGTVMKRKTVALTAEQRDKKNARDRARRQAKRTQELTQARASARA